MAKYYGKIGYCLEDLETKPGIWTKQIYEMDVFGDIYKNTIRAENKGTVNDNVIINNQISFIANPYAIANFQNIAYATINGVKIKVTSVEIAYPRIIITLGGVYNAEG